MLLIRTCTQRRRPSPLLFGVRRRVACLSSVSQVPCFKLLAVMIASTSSIAALTPLSTACCLSRGRRHLGEVQRSGVSSVSSKQRLAATDRSASRDVCRSGINERDSSQQWLGPRRRQRHPGGSGCDMRWRGTNPFGKSLVQSRLKERRVLPIDFFLAI